VQSSRLAEEETMRLVQSSRLAEEETMQKGSTTARLRLSTGFVDARIDAFGVMGVRWLGGGCRLLLCVVKALGGGDDAFGAVDAIGGSMHLYDGSEEVVACFASSRLSEEETRRKGLRFDDGSEEAVDGL
jgi:hypothetical protein